MDKRKTACVTLCGREIPLCLNMAAMERIDARFGSFEQMLEAMEKHENSGMIIDVAAILARGAQEMADGETTDTDVTEDWLRRHMRPGQMVSVSRAIGEAIAEGMRREEDDPGENEPKDVVLEELEAKKNTAR